MSYHEALRREARRIVMAQAVLTLCLAAGFGAWQGNGAALAALYGGMITLLITAWLAFRLRRLTAQTASAGMAVIWSSVVVRYGVAAVLVGAGIGSLKLAPAPLVVSFAVTQFGFLASPWWRPDAKKKTEVT
jgi:ATP synthase protein I